MKTLEISHVIKLAELDNYEQGCIGKPFESVIDYKISGKTKEELIKKLLDFTGGDNDGIMINPCGEEPNRIDVQVMENGEGYHATQSDIEAWKRQEIELYAVTYIAFVDVVERVPANLERD